MPQRELEILKAIKMLEGIRHVAMASPDCELPVRFWTVGPGLKVSRRCPRKASRQLPIWLFILRPYLKHTVGVRVTKVILGHR